MPSIAQYKDAKEYIRALEERMERYGIKKKQLAEALGVLSPQVSRWFSEDGFNPGADYIFKMERAYQQLKHEAIARKMKE
jgi:transcriptional regulator with XRE-family HTH domain